MKEIEITEMSDKQTIRLAIVAGIIFILIGAYMAGYRNGYKYVKDYYDDYIPKWCTCIDERAFVYDTKIPAINLSFLEEENNQDNLS